MLRVVLLVPLVTSSLIEGSRSASHVQVGILLLLAEHHAALVVPKTVFLLLVQHVVSMSLALMADMLLRLQKMSATASRVDLGSFATRSPVMNASDVHWAISVPKKVRRNVLLATGTLMQRQWAIVPA